MQSRPKSKKTAADLATVFSVRRYLTMALRSKKDTRAFSQGISNSALKAADRSGSGAVPTSAPSQASSCQREL